MFNTNKPIYHLNELVPIPPQKLIISLSLTKTKQSTHPSRILKRILSHPRHLEGSPLGTNDARHLIIVHQVSEHDATDAPGLDHAARSGRDHTPVHCANVVTVARLLLNLPVCQLLEQGRDGGSDFETYRLGDHMKFEGSGFSKF